MTFAANNTCLVCSDRSVNIIGVCAAVSDQCKTWSLDFTPCHTCNDGWLQPGVCTSCYDGWSLYNGVCTVTSTSPPPPPPSNYLCVTFATDGSCLVCSNRSVLKDGICVAVSDLCNTWDSTTGLCTSCYGGYTLTADGVCK